jgi:hypothetical protein
VGEVIRSRRALRLKIRSGRSMARAVIRNPDAERRPCYLERVEAALYG